MEAMSFEVNPSQCISSRCICFTRLAARWNMERALAVLVLWVRDKRQSQSARKKCVYVQLLRPVLSPVQFVACNCNLADNFIDSLTFRLIAVGKRVLHVCAPSPPSAALPPFCLITMRSLFWYFFSIF